MISLETELRMLEATVIAGVKHDSETSVLQKAE
jgi:hypothetical protein